MLDIERFRSLQGSNDDALLASVLDRSRDLIARHDEYFRGFPDVVRYAPLAEAIEQILRGKIDSGLTPLFQFEHAAALLADTLGERLDAGLFSECAPAFWDEVDTVIRRRLSAAGHPESAWPPLSKILERGPCLEIPLDPRWPLGSGFLDAGAVRTAAEVSETLDLEDQDGTTEDLEWPEEALDASRQFRGWLRRAAGKGSGLYFHA
jgi:hypothetical protein